MRHTVFVLFNHLIFNRVFLLGGFGKSRSGSERGGHFLKWAEFYDMIMRAVDTNGVPPVPPCRQACPLERRTARRGVLKTANDGERLLHSPVCE